MTTGRTETRTLDRVTAFTDAAVAIALTLLVLPLVDIAREVSDRPVATMLRDHADDFLAFALSFFVVALYWRAHRRLFEQVVRLDDTVITLNVLWLLGVVFLPVPTAVLTFEGEAQDVAVILYLTNLLFVALMGLGLSFLIWRRPRLREPETTPKARRAFRRSLVASGAMAVVTLLSVPLGSFALLLLAVLPAGQAVAERAERRRERATRARAA